MKLSAEIENESLQLLVDLLKIDTSNPPGNESAAASFLAEILRKDGYEPVIKEACAGRANLVVRRKCSNNVQSSGGPLLLTGHLDVVPADPTGWKHGPFAGVIDNGWLYGRGAVDMKNHLAACVTVMQALARNDIKLTRDVIFAAVADEERGCSLGSRFLVDEHPELVRADWGLGEIGGHTVFVGERRTYPIQIAHKGLAWISMRASGAASHSSIPDPASSNFKLARALVRLGNRPLRTKVTPPAREMILALASQYSFPKNLALWLLAKSICSDFLLESLSDDPQLYRTLRAVLRNTVSPTILKAGSVPNIQPENAEALLDGRILPGDTTSDLLREIENVVGDKSITLSVEKELPSYGATANSPLFNILVKAIEHMDPGAIPYPCLSPVLTDAMAFSRLGTQFYGFAPICIPRESRASFSELLHATDERIPVEGFKKGLQALWEVVASFCAA